MKLRELINTNLINSKNQKVQFRNIHNSISCEPITLIGKFEVDNPQLVDTSMWGVELLTLELSHIFTDDDMVVISLKDIRGHLRKVDKVEREYLKKVRKGYLYKRGY